MADQVFGIDFSGAEQAGNAIWIAGARIQDGYVHIESCAPASALCNSRSDRADCLAALVEFIARQRHAVIGCDFPFSLPAAMIRESTWRAFVLGFADRFPDAAAFLADCRSHAEGREIKRACDRESKVPFAAYNLRIYRQTYHGIRDVLAPLLRASAAAVLPMEAPRRDRPWVIEICPASTLKREGLYPSYKGRSQAARRARRRIIDGLVRHRLLAAPSPSLRRLAVENHGGDALDSMIAAAIAGRTCLAGTLRDSVPSPTERIEGRVYY